MKALVLSSGDVRYRTDYPDPAATPGETRVRILRAGICATDLALRRGYMSFEDIPGHEFVGIALEGAHQGKRVVGEINAACHRCSLCRTGLARHCPERTVLGILGRPGAFAETTLLPDRNLHPVPDSVATDAAVFAEPLAAAFEIIEQLDPGPGLRTLVAGDGRLGLLCAHVLHLSGQEVVVAGHHPERQELLPEGVELRTDLLEEDVPWHQVPAAERTFDLGVEATGRPEILPRLIGRIRPRGTLVVKTTGERETALDLSPAVVNELRIVGSRCGPFRPALGALARGEVPVERFISERYPLSEGARAFEAAATPGTLKVLLDLEGAPR